MQDSKSLFNWLQARSAGVLLHPTCFPGDQGVGVLDGEAVKFLDFLKAAGCSSWQICPLGPTGYGDSPYQCFSAFAGNPYLIDLAPLVGSKLLDASDLEPLCRLPRDRVDYGALYETKWPILARAYDRFRKAGSPPIYGGFAEFQKRNAGWLDSYAQFRALKDQHSGKPWWEWPSDSRAAGQSGSKAVGQAGSAAMHAFTQYLFFGQWEKVRAAARQRGISIIGDIPIFVAADGADVWARPDLFELDSATGRPAAVAGVPPDYFSADGQFWGNPLYVWGRHRAEKFAWWKTRLEASFAMYDILRIDHFRGFESYWRIPLPASNAKIGAWVEAPGLELFTAIRDAFPSARIIAEDLGILTPAVVELRKKTGLPGMAVLQFAFGGKPDNSYLPHNLEPNSVIYPGTHDNDTTLGWYGSAPESVRDHVRRYLRVGGGEAGWDFIRTAYASVSRLAVIPFQDILSLGSAGRFNTPGTPSGNWQWRYAPGTVESLSGNTAAYLGSLSALYGRSPAA